VKLSGHETQAGSRSKPPGLARSTVLNFADTAIGICSALVVSVVVARTLGPDRFGLYSLVTSMVMFAYVFARLGINETVRRYVAELDAGGERPLATIVAGQALRNGLVTSGASAVLLAAAAPALATFFHRPELTTYILIGALTLVPIITAGIFRNVLRGVQQYRYFVRLNLITSPVWVVACTAVVLRGGGIIGLLLVGLALELVHLVAFARWTFREVGVPRFGVRLPPLLQGRLVRYNVAVGALMVLDLVVQKRSELIFLGRFNGPDQVAFYALPFSLTDRLGDLMPGALLGVLLPGLTYARGSADPEQFSQMFSEAVRWLAVLTLPVCLFGIPVAAGVVGILYGGAYSPAVPVLQILLVALLFTVLGQAASAALLGLESQRWLLKVTAAAAVLSLCLDFLLIPRWGAVGAALANTIAQAAWALVSFWPLRHRIAKATRRAISRMAVVAGVIALLLGTALLLEPVLPAMVVGGLVAMVVYGLALERMHLLSPRAQIAPIGAPL
jgi:O-antigen/teichoic acid export membrane protein